MIYVLLAAAAAVAILPAIKPAPRPGAPAAPPRPSYADAIHALAVVRSRILQTEKLGEPEKAAIDAITLALVAGSDTE